MSSRPALHVFLLALLVCISACQGLYPARGSGPSVSILSPRSGETVRGELNVTGAASGSWGEALSVQVSLDGGPWHQTSGGRNWSWLWSTYASGDGWHTIRARASDGTSEAIAEAAVLVDNSPEPARIARALPAGDAVAIRGGESVEFNLSLEGSLDGVSVLWLVDGAVEGAEGLALGFQRLFPADPPGNHTVEARLVRGGDPLDSRSWVVTVRPPNRPPLIVSLTPQEANLTFLKGDRVRFILEAVDPDGDELSWSWRLDGEPINGSGSSLLLEMPSAGDHTLEATASDGELSVARSWNLTAAAVERQSELELVPFVLYFVAAACAGVAYGRSRRG
ncbi:MAG: Ig-like domain-containing protein [Thermoplasmatota archaeon]